ncbi:hypothetical protein DCE93_10525 [Agromyces badenianii]|uniref:Uncharacterized protein n=1 Tax=Agromyces badenianii TaxID=2080742 RepID=A0A2S0WXF8_9MICO|nr:hypothetical protein [Agromyces badenianii]AWB96039.1 hypothetical protein DCE93_10525 [Agromyces badenianii]PWC04901.1 hypothetical protein DCE94_00735 [Agromyces badenianii]
MSEALEGWTEFNVAMVGATAALAGLLIVAMSVNISTIMTSKTLPPRAASSIATLVLAIVAGALGLVPGQPVWAYGAVVLIASLVATAFQVHAMRVIAREPGSGAGDRALKSIAGVLPVAVFLLGAVLIVAGAAGAGLILVAVGSVLAIVSAILMAWIVLVEVLR